MTVLGRIGSFVSCGTTERGGSVRSFLVYSSCAAICLTLIAGCGGGGPTGPKRFAIKGAVTREGIPVDSGSVSFVPVNDGPAALAMVRDGQYAFTEEDGVPLGKYKVTVTVDPNYDKTYVGKKNDAPILPDDRFKKPIKREGYQLDAEVTDTPDQKIDFAVEPN
jgi:hypothetical protein